jgi:hypothetical protein
VQFEGTPFTAQYLHAVISGEPIFIVLLITGCFFAGVCFFLVGLKMWRTKERKTDKMDDIEFDIKKLDFQKMNAEEHVKKVLSDTAEQLQIGMEIIDDSRNESASIDLELARKMKEQSRKSNAIISRYISQKYREVEDSAIRRIEYILQDKYIIMNNLKIGSVEFDVIAKSKTDGADYIIEIKYLFSAWSWNASVWSRNLHSLYERERIYSRETKRNVSMILLIVTEEDERDKLEKLWTRKREHIDAKVIVLSSNEIDHLDVVDIVTE